MKKRAVFFLESMIFLQFALTGMRFLNYLTMSITFPWADTMLSGWDQVLGLDWVTYFEWVQSSRFLIVLLDWSYLSLDFVTALFLWVLLLLGEDRRARYFVDVFVSTALTCTIIGMFFPAKAAVVTYLGNVQSLAGFAQVPGVYHMDNILALRESGPPVLDRMSMPGLVTFPSFHTAAGILLICASYGTRLFIPVAIYAGVMIASTPVYGAHYFIDILAGTLIALAIAGAFAMAGQYRLLFPRLEGTTTAYPSGSI
ncbi:putative PAP2 family protein [Roseibium sp. TrichSKD4]|uniref:phosphatase PAP2 family protein n=1 Tax=Roseibium sp. TrichSKD4 TaxID=744980 RepID=UPI0001E576CF|nr:phosphatase PAP2 family protein [Roseibium sp. TrichSKD4]EFO30098.1 putative PAP2 family protein [Roseibium sp. TrichSKD4]